MSIGTALDKDVQEIKVKIDSLTKIKVIGVGGGGSNAVNNMISQDIQGVDFIAVNTDAQALIRSIAPARLRIGDKLTRGLGVGGDSNLGRLSADENRSEIASSIEGSDLLFITAGMGGGTGTGAAPVIAQIASELGVLTIAVVTTPFSFEGAHRAKVAEEGIAQLKEKADTLIVIHNDRLLRLCDENVSIEDAFKLADDMLCQSVRGIYDVISTVEHINLDFNDVKTIMSKSGHAWIAVGRGRGKTRSVDAAMAAIVNPLFDFSIENAKRILFNIMGNELTLIEVSEAANVIKQVADPEAQIIFGFGSDPELDRVVKLTLIATDFSPAKKKVTNDDFVTIAGGSEHQPLYQRMR